MRVLRVTEKAPLLEYLYKVLSDTKRTRVKQLLRFGFVSVNGTVTTRHDQTLLPDDQVSIQTRKAVPSEISPQYGVQVIFEDTDLVVVSKPPGLLTIATEKVKTETAFYAVNDYLNQKVRLDAPPRSRVHLKPLRKKQIFIVHRLDREASGLLAFAKNAEAKLRLQRHWQEARKKYYAVVEGIPERSAGQVASYLKENKILRVFSAKSGGKHSVTHYRVVRSGGWYALLEIDLETGRKHLIRVHLADLGHPIAGDTAYGARTNPLGRLALHAYSLAFKHPMSGAWVSFRTELPPPFEKLLNESSAKI
jgi:23S rRNA pseudouridine1911/1915/1917 synthase